MPITMTFLFLPLPQKNTPHHKTPPTINSSASNKSLWRASTHITSQDDMPNLLPSALIRKRIFTKMFSSFAGSTAATATPPLQTQSYKTTQDIHRNQKVPSNKTQKQTNIWKIIYKTKPKQSKKHPAFWQQTTISYFRRALLKKDTCKQIFLIFNPVKIWTFIYI